MVAVAGLKPDWWTKKDYAVLKAVQTFHSVKGRKALHKILYFVNLKTHMFKYQWYTYGPYSPELAYKIAEHVCDQSLDVEKYEDEEVTRYDMSLSEIGRNLLDGSSHVEIDSTLKTVYALLHDISPRRMELLASVHYITSCGYEQSKAGQILQNLKPASNFDDDEVEWAMAFLVKGVFDELESSKFLQSAC